MEKICPLFELKVGEIGTISRIDNLEKSKHKRLIELGFVMGARIEILKKNKNLAIVGIRGFAMCLDNLLLKSILVYRG